MRNLLREPVFEKGDGNWVDILPTTTKQYNNPIFSSTKLTPIKASSKQTERVVCHNLLDKRRRKKPKSEIHNLIRTEDLQRFFWKQVQINRPINCIKLQKLLKMQYQVRKSINFPKDIMKPCWNRLKYQARKEGYDESLKPENESKCPWPSLLRENNFVRWNWSITINPTRYTSGKNNVYFGWAVSKFFWYRTSKTDILSPTLSSSSSASVTLVDLNS